MALHERYESAMNASQFDYGEILNCMRCGFCLPTCPTYVETGNESASPRGRIALMKAAADGTLSLADIEEQMDLCLGCLNCVTACPAGVQFGHLLEDAREAVANTRPPTFVEKLMFNTVFPRPPMMRLVGALLWLYQASGLRWLAHKTGLANVLPKHVRDMDRILPRIRPPWQRKHKSVTEARATPAANSEATSSPRIAFFTGCVMDVVFWDENRDSIELLAAAGCTVSVIDTQTCCGALHAHSGQKEAAKQLARRNIAAFGAGEFDYIVNSIGGCGAALKEYGHWLKDDQLWQGRARSFAAKVRDLSEMLTQLGYEPPQADGRRSGDAQRVTMQHSCHLVHGQGVRHAPTSLLQQTGVQFCEMAQSDRCCGSAGIYNLTQPDMAQRVLDTKMEHVKDSGASVVVTTNPGCQLQMRLGVERARLGDDVQVLHIAEFLARNRPARAFDNEVT